MKSHLRRIFWQALALLGLDATLFFTTDVRKVPSFVVIIGFGLLCLTLYWGIRVFLKLGRLYGITIKRQRSLALYLTAILGGLVALQSVGQLNNRDFLVLLPLSIIGYSYGAYLKSARRNLSG